MKINLIANPDHPLAESYGKAVMRCVLCALRPMDYLVLSTGAVPAHCSDHLEQWYADNHALEIYYQQPTIRKELNKIILAYNSDERPDSYDFPFYIYI